MYDSCYEVVAVGAIIGAIAVASWGLGHYVVKCNEKQTRIKQELLQEKYNTSILENIENGKNVDADGNVTIDAVVVE